MKRRTIFEKSQKGQCACSLPKSDPAFEAIKPPAHALRQSDLALPEVSELDLTRHFTELESRCMGIDSHFYPLGSCTMKLNPRVNEVVAALPGFTRTHPLAPDDSVQGNLQMIHELIEMLCETCGMEAGSVVTNAGAHGEFAGVQMIHAYHHSRGDHERTEILVPDSAHGTNPATAQMAGFSTVTVPSDSSGDVDIDALRSLVSPKTAGLMLTNPNTLGLFSPQILDISKTVHEAGGLLYYDGANLNAIMNIARPGDMGFDVMHLNLHKTFSTPHGGGGPGSGPILCNKRLSPFLPIPRVLKTEQGFKRVWKAPDSIGQLSSFQGTFGIYLRAYTYAKLHGQAGLRRVSEAAVLNANYLKHHISKLFTVPFPQPCMHEFVVQADKFLSSGVRALDIAKRLLDYGIHAPTIYFPLIIKECLLIEPTETESKYTLDRFIHVLQQIIEEIKHNPEYVRQAPHSTSVKRIDEVSAAKNPILSCCSA